MLKLHKCRLLLSCPFYNVTKFDQSRQMRIDIILRFRLSLSQGAVKRWDARHLQLNGHKKKIASVYSGIFQTVKYHFSKHFKC